MRQNLLINIFQSNNAQFGKTNAAIEDMILVRIRHISFIGSSQIKLHACVSSISYNKMMGNHYTCMLTTQNVIQSAERIPVV